jgi:hypothetical protein
MTAALEEVTRDARKDPVSIELTLIILLGGTYEILLNALKDLPRDLGASHLPSD